MSGSAHVKTKLTKGRLAAIISCVAVCVLFLAAIILNVFVPLKYLSAYVVPVRARSRDMAEVRFLNVGHADCTLCLLPDGSTLLIDGGDGSYSANLAVLGALNESGVDKIDYLVCTSPLVDYCGGLAEIIKYKRVSNIFLPAISNPYITESYADFVGAAEECGARITTACYGNGVCGQNWFFTFLSPSAEGDPHGFISRVNADPSAENIRNASAVVWLEYAGTSIVFTSSAGSEALESVVRDYETITADGGVYAPVGEYGVNLSSCEVVTVPGHGAKECTSANWYNLLQPREAVVSVGENYSSLPSSHALADVCAYVERPRLTSVSGHISLIVSPNGYAFAN